MNFPCGRCYKYVNQSTNFLAAEQYCNSYGGHLTAVHSPVENAYVATLGNSNAGQSHKTWIGLNLLMSGSFSWTTSESLDYVSAWALGFPSVPSYYQCVSVSSDTTWRLVKNLQSSSSFSVSSIATLTTRLSVSLSQMLPPAYVQLLRLLLNLQAV